MALYSLGNVQISQARKLTSDGQKSEAAAKFDEAMETHIHVRKLWEITLGSTHHKTADVIHKVGWHYHRKRQYATAM